MLYYNFYGYEEFKARFGLEKRDNGVAVRKNRILLGHLKNPALLKYCREHNDYTLLHIYDMADLQKRVVEAVIGSGKNDEKLPYEVELIGKIYHSAKYRTDEAKGLCEDLDKSSVRYVNIESLQKSEAVLYRVGNAVPHSLDSQGLHRGCCINIQIYNINKIL